MFGDAVPVLQCPWHGWSFLLADGLLAAATSVATATARVRSYPVRVVAGRVTIELPQ